MQYILPKGAPRSGNQVDPSSLSSFPKLHSVEERKKILIKNVMMETSVVKVETPDVVKGNWNDEICRLICIS